MENNGNHIFLSGRFPVLLQDVGLSILASFLGVMMVRWLSAPISEFTTLVVLWIGCGLAVFLIGELLSRNYRVVRRYATSMSTNTVVRATLVKELMLIIVLVTGLVRFPSSEYAVVAMLADTLFTVLLLYYIRFAVQLFSGNAVRKVIEEASKKTALIAGTSKAAIDLAMEIEEEGRYSIVGFLTDDKSLVGSVILDRVVYYCTSEAELKALKWRLGGVDGVFFPRDPSDNDNPQASGQGHSNPEPTPSEPVPNGMSAVGAVVKRGLDVLASGILLLLFSPLAGLCALAVKWEDGGPALYKQERIGLNGRPFNILKFRSMREDAEAAGAQLYSGENDPRLTRVGAFLRKHHLDELPQLWNVFRGDMSFTGYRPERQVFIDQIMAHNPNYRYLYQIRPGVTSYATLYNGYTDTIEKMLTRLDLDLYYLRHHSLALDARVLGLTFMRIVTGKSF